MTFLHRGNSTPGRVALFPGAWNPPTVAHVEIARAARSQADEVIWVMPRAFPHKEFEGVSFEDRCRMLQMIAEHEGYSVAVSERGLYSEMADEARELLGSETQIAIVCGRDAAERMANWDYGDPGAFDALLEKYMLLVAARTGDYEPAARHSNRIIRLPMKSSWDNVSSSEVRRRVSASEDYSALVPPQLAGIVQKLYRSK